MKHPRRPAAERGIATLLILILIGIALTVAVLGTINRLRAGQEQSITFHSQTLAQARAWTAAEVLRTYLHEKVKDEVTWTAFKSALPALPAVIDITGFEGVSVSLRPETNLNGASPSVTAQITARAVENTRAESSSTLEIVYRLTPPGGGTPPPEPHLRVIDFRGGLEIEGGTIRVESDVPYQMYVDGNVSINNLNIHGIDTLRSTKSIKFSGGSSSTGFKEMHANCDVSLSGAAGFTVDNVKATRNACLANTVNSKTIAANGSVEVTGGTHGDIYAHANRLDGEAKATCSADSALHCSLPVDFGVRSNPTPTIDAIYSKADIEFTSSAIIHREVRAEHDLKVGGCTPVWEAAFYGRNYYPLSCAGLRSANSSNSPIPISPVLPVGVIQDVFDVNTLRSTANYIFSYTGDRIRVKVKGVQGIPDYDGADPDAQPDGYYLTLLQQVPSGTPFYNGLCRVPNPASAADCLVKIGIRDKNNPWSGTVITYSNSRFVLNGGNANASIAPGVAFFEGDLVIEGGAFTNTFIATGNITVSSSGSGAVFAPNYVGRNTAVIGSFTAIGVCSNDQYSPQGLVPTGFCTEDGTYDYSAHGNIGNYALLAGSCAPPWDGENDCIEYKGGDIQVQKRVYGVIKAGNTFQTTQQGTSVVHGYISALGQRSGSSGMVHDMRGSTTIYLDKPNEGYNPTGGLVIPAAGGGTGGGAGPGSALIRWSRYL